MSKRYILLTILALLVTGIFLANNAWAFDIKQGIVGNLSASCRVDGDCTWCDFVHLFVTLQRVILSLFGGLALIMIIWGGTGILTSAGNTQKVAEGKKLIVSTLLGVVIVLAGYFLIVVTVFVLATPRDTATGKALPIPVTSMFSGDAWKLAFCPTTVTDCERQYGNQGYSCKSIGSCSNTNIQTYDDCVGSNQCVKNLCPGSSTGNDANVCCK